MTHNALAVVVPAYNEQDGISRTLASLLHQSTMPEAIVVVDNNSTDDTAGVVEAWQKEHPVIHLVHEEQKGTGVASNAGFRHSIDNIGVSIIARTDADTQPATNWVEVITCHYDRYPSKMLISGPSKPMKDEHYRRYDSALWPLALNGYRLGNVVLARSLMTLRLALGHNLAMTKEAFKELGGFANTTIAECDEDIDITKRAFRELGYAAMDHVPGMLVYTSMRRIRRIGYHGLFAYYGTVHSVPSPTRRTRMSGGEIDIR